MIFYFLPCSCPTIKQFLMDAFKWSNELIEILIFLWQQHEILYNVKHKDFRNKEKRSNAVYSIYTELKKMDDNITLGAIRSKIHSLCAQFAAEIRQQKNKKDEPYKPVLWCYDQLKFLENRCWTALSKPKIDTVILNPTKKSSIVIQKKLQPLQVLLKRKLENKYDWLGQQLVFKMSRIQDEGIRKASVRAIQYLLENTEADGKISNSHGNDCQTGLPKKNKQKKQNANEENETDDLQKQVLGLKQLVKKRFEFECTWLGKQVTEVVSKIKDEKVREESAWTIQCILHESVKKDKLVRQQNADNQNTIPANDLSQQLN